MDDTTFTLPTAPSGSWEELTPNERAWIEFIRIISCGSEPSEHRRAHRPGRPPRIDSDPELRAFIRARIDRMTFTALAEEVAKAFPPERRVGKSAIHAWWQKNHR